MEQINAVKTNFRLVAFDLDGTICNTLKDIASSLNRALDALGFQTYSDEGVSGIIGKSIVYMCKHAVPEDRAEAWTDVRDGFLQDYAEHLCDTTVPYPEMPGLLHALKDCGITLAIVTNKPDPHAKKMIRTLFPEEGLFARVQGQCADYPVKPDPTMLNVVRESLGFSREETLYLGDMDVDLQFAKNAGLKCVGCGWGYRGEAFLKEAGAEHVISHPLELLEIIDTL
jgi:phosphoglycolate phosphatase